MSPALQAGSLPPSHWGSPCSVLEINARDKVNEGHLSCNREGVEILERRKHEIGSHRREGEPIG